MNKGLIKYELINYLYSGKEIAPFVLFMGWIGIEYSIGPINIFKSFGLCSLVIFLTMIMISLGYADVTNQMIEQSIYVKLLNKNHLYSSKIIFVAFMSFIFSLFGIILPLLIYVLGHFTLFDRVPTVFDLFASFSLLFVSALSGGIIGLFANKRIFCQHRLAVIFCSLIGLITIFKGNITKDFFAAKFITWMLPPIYELCEVYTNTLYLKFEDVALYFLWIILYIVILSIAYIRIMLYKNFE